MHPLERVDRPTLRALFLVALAVTLASGVALVVVGAPLAMPAAPFGVISLEFARDAEAGQAIVDAWGQRLVVVAAFGVGLDYAFIAGYANAIALAALLASPPAWTRRARVVAWLAWTSGALDVVENVALWRTLSGDPSTQIVAGLCAPPKFALAVVGILYAGAAVVARRRA